MRTTLLLVLLGFAAPALADAPLGSHITETEAKPIPGSKAYSSIRTAFDEDYNSGMTVTQRSFLRSDAQGKAQVIGSSMVAEGLGHRQSRVQLKSGASLSRDEDGVTLKAGDVKRFGAPAKLSPEQQSERAAIMRTAKGKRLQAQFRRR